MAPFSFPRRDRTVAEDQVSKTTSGTTGQAPDAPAGQAPTIATASPTQPGQAPDASRPTIDTLPEEWQRTIRELREENAAHRKAKQAAEQQAAEAATKAKQAEESALAEQQQWRELAERREREIAELRPSAALATELSEWIAGYINKAISTWPEEVKAMAPNGETTPLAMLEWLEKARPLAERLNQPTTPAPGVGNRPRPVGIGQAANARLAQEAQANIRRQF
jgi:hypothetical protein